MKNRRAFVFAGALLAVMMMMTLLLAACHSSNPASPSDPFVGVWSGTLNDEVSGLGALTFVLNAGPAGSLTGTWAATFPDPANNNGGTLSATVPLGPPLVFGLDCAGSGAALFTMTANGNHMAGTYESVTCQRLRRGTAELIKQ